MRTYVSMLVAFAVLISCGKEDPLPVNQLIGSWTIKLTEPKMSVDGQDYDLYLVDHGYTPDEAANRLQEVKAMMPSANFYSPMEFKEDGTWTSPTPAAGKWTMSSSGEQLSLTNDTKPGVTAVARVTKLTDADLWIITTPTVDLPSTVVPTNFTYTVTIKLARLK